MCVVILPLDSMSQRCGGLTLLSNRLHWVGWIHLYDACWLVFCGP